MFICGALAAGTDVRVWVTASRETAIGEYCVRELE